jgi:predicted Zn-dependent protease with MMP-like domain
MSDLVPIDPGEIQVAEIVDDALSHTPQHLHHLTIDVYFHLAELGELESIQSLILEASRGSELRLQKMVYSVRAEMMTLRKDMETGFERLHAYHELQHQLTREELAALRSRVEALEADEDEEPAAYVVYHHYEDNRSYHYTEGSGGEPGFLASYATAAAGWLIGATLLALIGNLILSQFDQPPRPIYQPPPSGGLYNG